MSGATLPTCGERSVAALPGGAKPFAGRVGWRGLPLRTDSRRGHRLPTDSGYSPAPRAAPGLILRRAEIKKRRTGKATKSGACIGTSSTANAVPLPLIGEGLSAVDIGARLRMAGATLPTCGERSVAALPGGAKPFAGRVGWRGLPLRTASRRGQRLSTDSELSPAPREAPGSGLRCDHCKNRLTLG